MTEYVALVLGIGIIMVYLVHIAFNLSENYDPLKMFLILVSMFFGVIMIHLADSIAIDQAASYAIRNSLSIAYYAWLTVTCLSVVYFTLTLIYRGWNAVTEKKKVKMGDEDNI